jgi:hypothetical protein
MPVNQRNPLLSRFILLNLRILLIYLNRSIKFKLCLCSFGKIVFKGYKAMEQYFKYFFWSFSVFFMVKFCNRFFDQFYS